MFWIKESGQLGWESQHLAEMSPEYASASINLDILKITAAVQRGLFYFDLAEITA